MDIENRLQALGLVLPPDSVPSHSYIPARQTGNLLYLAGQGPKRDGMYPYLGKLGAGVTLEQGEECARICVLNSLAAAKGYLGDLTRIKAVVKVNGYVASDPSFTQQPQVMNAASRLIIDLLGEAGRHARTSVGVPVLPGDIPVEIEMLIEIET